MEIISDDDFLYRRLHPKFIDADGTISSQAFSDKTGNVSVDIARLTTPEESVARALASGYGLVVLQAKIPRELGLQVYHDPIEGNEAHAIIEGVKTHPQRKQLAKAATVLIQPTLPTTSDP